MHHWRLVALIDRRWGRLALPIQLTSESLSYLSCSLCSLAQRTKMRVMGWNRDKAEEIDAEIELSRVLLSVRVLFTIAVQLNSWVLSTWTYSIKTDTISVQPTWSSHSHWIAHQLWLATTCNMQTHTMSQHHSVFFQTLGKFISCVFHFGVITLVFLAVNAILT